MYPLEISHSTEKKGEVSKIMGVQLMIDFMLCATYE